MVSQLKKFFLSSNVLSYCFQTIICKLKKYMWFSAKNT